MPKNSIDALWAKEAEELTNGDIDEIIAYQIKLLQNYESGVKPKREVEEQIDFQAVISQIARAAGKTTTTAKKSTFKRRI